jgi:DNA-binding transcriptional LysR family regulator
MDLKRIRTFVTVAEQGSLVKASVHLRITQPALSRQIAEFQRELELRLFDKVGRKLVLTTEGEQLLVECRSLLRHAEALGDRARLIRGSDSGVLNIAASSVGMEVAFAELLHRYRHRYPRVKVRLVEAAGSDLVTMVARGDVHFGICLLRSVQADGRDLATYPLQPVELLAACHPSFPLKRGKMLDVSDVADHPLLLLESALAVRKTFDALCRVGGVTPDILLESAAPSNLLALAEAGHGIAIISSLIRTHRYKLRIVRMVHERRPIREPLALVSDKRRTLPRYAEDFRKQLAAHMSKHFTMPGAVNADVQRSNRQASKQRSVE